MTDGVQPTQSTPFGPFWSAYSPPNRFRIRGTNAFSDLGMKPKSAIFPHVSTAPAEEKAAGGQIWAE
jgi:hypothetical protein